MIKGTDERNKNLYGKSEQSSSLRPAHLPSHEHSHRSWRMGSQIPQMQKPSEPNTSENPSAMRAPPLLAPSPIPLVEWSLIVNKSLPHDKLIQLPGPISESILMSSDSPSAIVAGRQHGPKSIRESFHFQTHSASIPISLAQLILGSVALPQDNGTLATIYPACRIHAQPLLLQIRGHYATSPDFCNGARFLEHSSPHVGRNLGSPEENVPDGEGF
ncbi:hypothetical protein HO173_009603 [Letharia columbiana]|uniref:Uncharacterized protein n=1 Tax=Letharia columbiana TaxID=112416 RepID=A0A8H6L1P3_9LECA|nr:uncharacterized protein HO173_009603 [Letharia columbiana]KAF6232220.1 hypothetical protein HO173_009603 [Letharia columbiana]